MKLSNKFALISSLVSSGTGIPLVLSCVWWTIPFDVYGRIFSCLGVIALVLGIGFYFFQGSRLRRAIDRGDNKIIYDTPIVCALHTLLDFGIFIFVFTLLVNIFMGITSLKNIVRIGFSLLPVGLIEMSLVYSLSFFLLTPYYETMKKEKLTGLNIGRKILFLAVPVIIFSGFTGYVITKSWGGLVYLVFPCFVVWALIKMIKEPIDYINERMQDLLKESFSLEEKKKIISGDEIASIDEILSLFLEKTISLISDIKSAADNVRTQGEAILSGIRRGSSSAKQVDKSVREVLSSKEESEQIINAVEKNNEGLASLSAEIESQIRTLMSTSENLIDLSNSGEEKSEEGVNRISTFVQKIGEGSKSLEELSSAFEEIKEFNSLMEQISDDTNLLALNASIEATRKEGEESKGFSVIADEIRKLSNDSASYLEKTKENIKRMSEAVHSIVESTEKSISIFEESKSIIQKTAEDLKGISEAIGMTTNMAEQISSILKEGSNFTDEIKKSAKKLSSLNEKQVESALTLSKETEEQVASMEDTEIRVQTLISLLDKIKEIE
jgi:methyl-accepting chemotaxis protein